MSVLAEFSLPASEFVLADTLTSAPEMRVEIKRVVGDDSTVTPYFWATGGDFDRFEEALQSDDEVTEMMMIEENENVEGGHERFYRVTWKSEVPNIITAVSEAKATILEAVSEENNQWHVKVLFPNDRRLSAFHDYCIDHGYDVNPLRVYSADNPEEQAEYGVTEGQQQALEAAYHADYFEVPRDHTLADISEGLGISQNALSARLRRGQRNLLASTLIHEEGSE